MGLEGIALRLRLPQQGWTAWLGLHESPLRSVLQTACPGGSGPAASNTGGNHFRLLCRKLVGDCN
eukprot:1826864-Rhodomonas_salina.1